MNPVTYSPWERLLQEYLKYSAWQADTPLHLVSPEPVSVIRKASSHVGDSQTLEQSCIHVSSAGYFIPYPQVRAPHPPEREAMVRPIFSVLG